AFWPSGVSTLDDAERAMLELSCQRARLGNGQRILELGCGWGSLTLFAAERFPESSIVAVSNSATQKLWIDRVAADRGLRNIEVRTSDMRTFDPGETFDRIVS